MVPIKLLSTIPGREMQDTDNKNRGRCLINLPRSLDMHALYTDRNVMLSDTTDFRISVPAKVFGSSSRINTHLDGHFKLAMSLFSPCTQEEYEYMSGLRVVPKAAK